MADLEQQHQDQINQYISEQKNLKNKLEQQEEEIQNLKQQQQQYQKQSQQNQKPSSYENEDYDDDSNSYTNGNKYSGKKQQRNGEMILNNKVNQKLQYKIKSDVPKKVEDMDSVYIQDKWNQQYSDGEYSSEEDQNEIPNQWNDIKTIKSTPIKKPIQSNSNPNRQGQNLIASSQPISNNKKVLVSFVDQKFKGVTPKELTEKFGKYQSAVRFMHQNQYRITFATQEEADYALEQHQTQLNNELINVRRWESNFKVDRQPGNRRIFVMGILDNVPIEKIQQHFGAGVKKCEKNGTKPYYIITFNTPEQAYNEIMEKNATWLGEGPITVVYYNNTKANQVHH
ncbi:hypothetical protein PPERSA_07182 [Pseudocohnilembus persalinus]|uniref:RRM domain-containing protein n=1 Tax=Pseudocohnilembus persalinus TaxID=266149 RepID=A0A0V0QXN1_PSEPJ|nr:hypothetical protein PPERSA_07182 [Pseudocohnilembus persalinus]|eukprot:KRX07019.1 hypothetical protein PPERSA_07182 [Pseudocohnilembus persalinus]